MKYLKKKKKSYKKHAVSFDLYEVQREVKLMGDGKYQKLLLSLLKDKIGKWHKELSGVVIMVIRVFVT